MSREETDGRLTGGQNSKNDLGLIVSVCPNSGRYREMHRLSDNGRNIGS